MQNLINELLTTVLLGFSIYNSVVYLCRIRLTASNKFFSTHLTKIISIFTIAASLGFILYLFVYTMQPMLQAAERLRLSNRVFGPYWHWFWLNAISFSLPLLLLFKRVSKSNKARFLIALPIFYFMVQDNLTILLTSIHRDYLPTTGGSSIIIVMGWMIETLLELTAFYMLVLFVSRFTRLKINDD